VGADLLLGTSTWTIADAARFDDPGWGDLN
jgi:hypothetical protein